MARLAYGRIPHLFLKEALQLPNFPTFIHRRCNDLFQEPSELFSQVRLCSCEVGSPPWLAFWMIFQVFWLITPYWKGGIAVVPLDSHDLWVGIKGMISALFIFLGGYTPTKTMIARYVYICTQYTCVWYTAPENAWLEDDPFLLSFGLVSSGENCSFLLGG